MFERFGWCIVACCSGGLVCWFVVGLLFLCLCRLRLCCSYCFMRTCVLGLAAVCLCVVFCVWVAGFVCVLLICLFGFTCVLCVLWFVVCLR